MTSSTAREADNRRPTSISRKISTLVLTALVALALRAAPAVADDAGGAEPPGGARTQSAASQEAALEEIVVTAQKRTENLQAVPIAITALSADKLAGLGVASTEDLAAASPGVLITQFGQANNALAIYVRGIGQLDFAEHQESPVALYIDGAYLSFQGAAGLGLYDVQQLSILRGPQGTLFGRNANGGVVQITTNKPTDNFTGYFQQGFGSYGQFNTEGAIGGPLSDKLDVRFSFLYNHQSPWLHNTLGASLGADNTAGGRLQLLYKFSEDTQDLLQTFISRTFPIAAGVYVPTPAAPNPANHGLAEDNSSTLFVQYCSKLGFVVSPGATNCQGYRTGGDPFDVSFQFSDPRVGNFARSIWGITNTFTDQMSWAKLTSITDYTSYGKHYLEEDSNNPIPIVGYRNDADAYQVSEELQLNGQSASLNWVAGLYFLTIRGSYDNDSLYTDIYNLILLTGTEYEQNVTTYAAYGQVDYAFSSRWSMTLGGRVERDKKAIYLTAFCTIANPALCTSYGLVPTSEYVQGDPSDTEWSGNLQLKYQPSSDLMLYAGIRRGTKGAAISATTYPAPGITFASIYVKPEILTDTEVGFKSELFSRRVRLNGDLFYYDYQNYQAFQFVNFTSILFNAPAQDYGAELSVSALLTPTLTANFGLAYLHTRVKGVELPDGTFGDQVQPLAPNLSATADLRKEWHESFGTLFAVANVFYVGSRFYGSVNQPEIIGDKYVAANLSAGYTTPDGKWSSALSVKNIANKVITVDRFDVVSSGGYSERSLAPPRWVTFDVRYNF